MAELVARIPSSGVLYKYRKEKWNQWIDFLMIFTAGGIISGRLRTTVTTATESSNNSTEVFLNHSCGKVIEDITWPRVDMNFILAHSWDIESNPRR